MRRQLFGVLLLAAAVVATGGNLMAVDCSNDACCVNAATCVVTDRETLEALSIDQVLSCDFNLSTWVSGGGTTGLAPNSWPANLCGLSFSINAFTAAQAYNSLDHKWLQSTGVPKVSDFGTPVNTVFVFPAVDHGPFPEEGIESTVWGRTDSSSTAGFPAGWTLATLTTIWKKGWEEPAACNATPDNADDFTGQYSFPGDGFRYIAVHANYSISIFHDAAHTTWTGASDNSGVPGWQSFDDEIDAVGSPVCDVDTVIADAGPDQAGIVGDQLCFNASGSSGGIVNYGWDLDGDSEIDVSGLDACITCTEETEGDVTLFVSDDCGCVDSDTAHFTCTLCDPDPRTQGYWHRQCLGVPASEGGIDPGRNGRGPQEPLEANFAKELMPAIDDQLELLLAEFSTCDGLDADPASDPCQRALKQFTALLLNIETDRLQSGCNVDVSSQGCTATTVGELVDELAALILAGECQVASECAGAVNEGEALTEAAVAGLVVQTDRATETGTDLTAPSSGSGGRSSLRTDVSVQADPVTATEPVTESGVMLMAPTLEPAEEEVIEEVTTELETVQRHLLVMANPSAPERATDVSRDSLLTTLSGGFDPELRLEIVKALIHRVDASYHALLAAHLEDIRNEAVDFGKDDLAGEAERLLKRLDSAGK